MCRQSTAKNPGQIDAIYDVTRDGSHFSHLVVLAGPQLSMPTALRGHAVTKAI